MHSPRLPFCPSFFRSIFGQLFVKRFAYAIGPLSVCPVLSCLSVCLSATLMYCGQTVGRINIKLGTQVCRGPGHIVLDGDPAPLPKIGHSPQTSAHVCCGQTAGWLKMPLGTTVGLDPGNIVLDAQPPIFGPSIVAKRWHLSIFFLHSSSIQQYWSRSVRNFDRSHQSGPDLLDDLATKFAA